VSEQRSGFLIEIDWEKDVRNAEADQYLFGPSSREKGRRTAFLRGWSDFVNNPRDTHLTEVTWDGLGMVYASILGDIPIDQRKAIYRLLLGQYLSTKKVEGWTGEEREEALRLVAES
jgi:hypothetical protein